MTINNNGHSDSSNHKKTTVKRKGRIEGTNGSSPNKPILQLDVLPEGKALSIDNYGIPVHPTDEITIMNSNTEKGTESNRVEIVEIGIENRLLKLFGEVGTGVIFGVIELLLLHLILNTSILPLRNGNDIAIGGYLLIVVTVLFGHTIVTSGYEVTKTSIEILITIIMNETKIPWGNYSGEIVNEAEHDINWTENNDNTKNNSTDKRENTGDPA